MPFAIIPGSGLPMRLITQNIAIDGAERSGDRGVRRHHCEPDVGHRERRGGVEAEPAEQQDERAEHGHRDVVRPECSRLAVLAVLADAGTEDDRARESGDAAHRVHDAGSGEVDVAEAEVCALAQLASQPPPHVHAPKSG